LNHRGGFALIKSTWLSWLQYRSFFFVLAFGWMIPPLVAMFVWLAASGQDGIQGIQRSEFVAYYLVLILVNQVTYSQANWTLGDVIREGLLNNWLLRPISPFYQVLSSEFAGKFVYLIFTIPLTVLLGLVLRPTFDLSFQQISFFLLSLILAWGLRFLWGYWIALLAFWFTRADALLALQDSLVFIFSGMIAPVSLLPGFLQNIAIFLPFRYMVGFPVEIFTNQLTLTEIGLGVIIQSTWLIVALTLCSLLWKNGLQRYSAIGG